MLASSLDPSSWTDVSCARVCVPQTIALYIDINVHWPPMLRQMMLWFSALNINFELARPECSGARVPSLSFSY